MAQHRAAPAIRAVTAIDAAFADRSEWPTLIDDARVNADVAQSIYALRTAAGLTQRALAERVASTQSAIARLEDSDYRGHSLSMLIRIARALGHEVTVSFAACANRSGGGKSAGRSRPARWRRPCQFYPRRCRIWQ